MSELARPDGPGSCPTGEAPHGSSSQSDRDPSRMRVERAAKAAWEHQGDKLDPDCPEANETWETTNGSARNLWRSLAEVMLAAADEPAGEGLRVHINGRFETLTGLSLEVYREMLAAERVHTKAAFHRGYTGGLGFSLGVCDERGATVEHVKARIAANLASTPQGMEAGTAETEGLGSKTESPSALGGAPQPHLQSQSLKTESAA